MSVENHCWQLTICPQKKSIFYELPSKNFPYWKKSIRFFNCKLFTTLSTSNLIKTLLVFTKLLVDKVVNNLQSRKMKCLHKFLHLFAPKSKRALWLVLFTILRKFETWFSTCIMWTLHLPPSHWPRCTG